MLKHLTVGKKIGLGFAGILMLLVVVGIIAIIALNKSTQGFTDYRNFARDSNLAGRIQSNALQARFEFKDYMLNPEEQNLRNFEERWNKVTELINEAKSEIDDPENAKRMTEVAARATEYKQAFDQAVSLSKAGEKSFVELNNQGPLMEKALTEIMLSTKRDGEYEAAAVAGMAMKDVLLCRLYAVKYHDAHDSKLAERFRKEFANLQESLGILDKKIKKSEARRDLTTVFDTKVTYEKAFEGMYQALSDEDKIINNTMDKLGPLVGELLEQSKLAIIDKQNELGPRLQASNVRSVIMISVLGISALLLGILAAIFIVRGITGSIKNIVNGLSESAGQVASASTQVSSSSQQLAEGTSEQASALEETSSSLEEMSSMTRQNADNAQQGQTLMNQTSETVDLANESMSTLTVSMEEISKRSQETQKVVKTIEEIAFQTNLLALNAAVEAARAGEAGAGFAVVADEVRNLAIRAAAAAKDTGTLIEASVRKIGEGSDIVTKTNVNFKEVASSAKKVKELVHEIAAASKEQAQGIEQINRAVAEMDKAVQSNAASAEESASAAEEMNAQAKQMEDFVSELLIMVGQQRAHAERPAIKQILHTAVHQKTANLWHNVKKLKPDQAQKGSESKKENANEKVLPLSDNDDKVAANF